MLSSGIFWGILIVVFGLILLIKHIFELDIPVVKAMLGAFLVLLGINMLLSNNQKHQNVSFNSDDSVVFGSKTFVYDEDQNEYNAVFSDVTVDLTDLKESNDHIIEMNAIFSDMKVLLNKSTKVKIKSDAVFGNIENPEDEDFLNKNDSTISHPEITIKASAVFGNMKFIRE